MEEYLKLSLEGEVLLKRRCKSRAIRLARSGTVADEWASSAFYVIASYVTM